MAAAVVEAVAEAREGQPKEKTSTARMLLREFLEHVLEGEDEIVVGEVMMYAQAKFVGDEEFHQALLAEVFPVMVADELRDIIHRRRSAAISRYVPTAFGGISQEKLDARAKDIAARIFVRTKPGVRKSFMVLVKPEIKADVIERKARIAGEQLWVGLEEEILQGMKNNKATVDESFTDAAFERIWRKHFEPKAD